MKFAVWRHENSLGNSAEHTYGLCKHMLRNNINGAKIYVEKEFQKHFVMCIPGVEEKNIRFFNKEICSSTLYSHPFAKDIYFPNVYREHMTYPASWKDLSERPDCTLQFPDHLYENKHNLPKDCILIQFREFGTFNKRAVGAYEETERFVKKDIFFKLAEHYANKGHKVVRLGDRNQTPLPNHENIIDLAMFDDKSMMDDLFLISNCRAFISCDSGIWPIAGAMKKNLVLCNVVSPFYPFTVIAEKDPVTGKVVEGTLQLKKNKSAIVDWLPKKTTKILYKTLDIDRLESFLHTNGNQYFKNSGHLKDNSFKEIQTALQNFL